MRLGALAIVALAACSSKELDRGGGAGGAAGSAGSAGNSGESGAGSNGEAGAGASASTLRFTGTAAADVDAANGGAGSELSPVDRIECNFYGEILDPVADDAGGWSGTAIGEVFRYLYSDGARFEFSALIGGPATLKVLDDDHVELRAFGDQTGAKPFWLELEALEAQATGPDTYEGTWTCASLELAEPGFPDVGYAASGTWQLGP